MRTIAFTLGDKKQRKVRIYSEDNHCQCLVYGQILHMMKMIDGKPYCELHTTGSIKQQINLNPSRSLWSYVPLSLSMESISDEKQTVRG